MRQVLQDLRGGRTYLEEVPAPLCRPGNVLIQTTRSVISPGTERMLMEFGKAGLLKKAMLQPERVRDVISKLQTDGIAPTVEAIFSKLNEPLPLGYCNVGRVIECGDDELARLIPVGSRVVSNSNHAEYVLAGRNLVARVPDAVSDEHAAFAVPGAIALQGIRLMAPTLGESVCVMGLGLMGLLAVQLLRANGCRVFATDFNGERLALAEKFGATVFDLSKSGDVVTAAMNFSGGRGVDGVLITASSDSKEPIRQAAKMSRMRGRIVLVGVTTLDLDRTEFYKKEITFQVSCSYGPGRHDPAYEEQGHDYPAGFVRWTEQRNFEAILELLAAGKLDVAALITHRYPIARAEDAYRELGNSDALGIVLEYANPPGARPRSLVRIAPLVPHERIQVGFLGAGNFSQRVLLPLLKRTDVAFHTIVSQRGLSATAAARKLGFANASSDPTTVLEDATINCVFITTPHGAHASQISAALRMGKHVFAEKPLATTLSQLREIRRALAECEQSRSRIPALMVGFNRRFSPHARRAAAVLANRTGPACFQYTINAGRNAAKGWLADLGASGGRVIGECCHFIDLLRSLAGSRIVSVNAVRTGRVGDDSCVITLGFADGSIGSINYFANGPKNLPKERLLIAADTMAIEVENFRCTTIHCNGTSRKLQSLKQDKGHAAEIREFVKLLRAGGKALIPLEELEEVTLATLAAEEAITSGQAQRMDEWRARLDATREEETARCESI